ncbi:hypothetical protein CCACVL1_04612 [Corchorus capsularis]|uniref:DUF4283 domain-containing protein n=1 Tax=Corchorus capsularis TaxID=210143 RepID=A0A1R3JR42_COCAP|nr:hypothetical protein CCACVL1_04612 [Corchorus capsularis]
MEEDETFSDEDPEPIRVEGVPFVKVDKEKRDALRRPWRFSVIVKRLGRSLAFLVFHQRLVKLWSLKEEDEMIDLDYGYYVIMFRTRATAAKILSGGPWKIMDHYLVVQRWKPNFRSSTALIGKMAIWIHLPELPIKYFNMEMLMNVGRQLGKPIRLDTNTSKVVRGKFARICVEIDLFKPLVSRVQKRLQGTLGDHADSRRVSALKLSRNTGRSQRSQANISIEAFKEHWEITEISGGGMGLKSGRLYLLRKANSSDWSNETSRKLQ